MTSGVNNYVITGEVQCENILDEGLEDERECGWEGEVVLTVVPEYDEALWECPVCRADQSMTYYNEPDPDRDRD